MALTDLPPTRPTLVNVIEATRAAYSELRKSERKVADVFLADPRRMLPATLAQAAELARVSQPTVIRFCVAIGCSGFQEFNLRLAHSLALGTPATHSALSAEDDLGSVIEKVFDYTITSLDWARNHLDIAAIEFFGFGASGIVASDAQQKFPLFGAPCGAHQQIMAASMMRPNDVAVVISNTGRTRSIIQIASAARGCGAKVIGVTGSESPLAAECDVALIVETLDNTNILTPTISRIAALVVIDVLSTVVALRRGEEHQERFREMKRRLNDLRFEGQPQGLRAPVASARASAGEGRRLRPSVMEVKDHQ